MAGHLVNSRAALVLLLLQPFLQAVDARSDFVDVVGALFDQVLHHPHALIEGLLHASHLVLKGLDLGLQLNDFFADTP